MHGRITQGVAQPYAKEARSMYMDIEGLIHLICLCIEKDVESRVEQKYPISCSHFPRFIIMRG